MVLDTVYYVLALTVATDYRQHLRLVFMYALEAMISIVLLH